MLVAVSRTRGGSHQQLGALCALYCTQLPGVTTQKMCSCCLYVLCSQLVPPTYTKRRIERKKNIAVALDSSYEEIRCATHAPVRNASGEGPSECYFRSSPIAPRRETLLGRNSMMAFQLSFSTSALKYRCKPKTNENDTVAKDLEKPSTSIR